jgi:hypothetical protein
MPKRIPSSPTLPTTTWFLAYTADIERPIYTVDERESTLEDTVTGNLFFTTPLVGWTPATLHAALEAVRDEVKSRSGASHVWEPTITFVMQA